MPSPMGQVYRPRNVSRQIGPKFGFMRDLPIKAEENDVFVEVSPKRSIMSRRKSLLKASHGRTCHFVT